jgi:DNA-binding HxlR family transcriptional regulator
MTGEVVPAVGSHILRSASAASQAIEVVGDAWSWLVMREAVFDGVGRFDELQARLGVARSTLTARLTQLSRAGLLDRRPDPIRPSQRIYVPTDLGWDFFTCLMTAMRWGDRWACAGGARPLTLVHADCGSRLDADLSCARCSATLRARDVSVWRSGGAAGLAAPPTGPRSRTPELSLLERERDCSIARTLKVIGDRWSSLILRSSFFGTRRFDDFHRELGIAESILSQRLGRLIALGVLTRRAYRDNPPRDEYLLTDAGLGLYPIYLSMLAWGDRWLADGSDATTVLEHKLCGHSVAPVLVCAACRGALHTGSIIRADR